MAGLVGSCVSDPLSCPGQVLGGAAQDAASSGLKALADGTFDFLGNVLKLLTTFWISTPDPDLTSAQSPVALLQANLRTLAMFAMVAGLLFAGMKIMWTARSSHQPGALGEAFKGILLTVVVTGAGAFCVSVLLSAFDGWADHILASGFDGVGVGSRISELAAGHGTLGSVFGVVLYGLAALSSLAQFALMLLRGPVLVLLCGAWPVSAANAVTKEGGEAFRRMTAWLASWSLYKLVAAVIYATAFAMVGDSRDELGTVEGCLLLVVAIVALPSLMRLISPAAHAISSGGGQLMMAGASAGGQMLGAAAIMRSAGQGAQTHPVGRPSRFSGGSDDAAAAGAAATGARTATGSSGSTAAGPPGGTGASRPTSGNGTSAAGAGGAGGAAGQAGGTRAAAAAGGPAGAGTAAAGQAVQLAQRQVGQASGAIDRPPRTGDTP